MRDPDLRRAVAYILPYWRRLVLVLGLSLAGTALSLYLPYLSKELIDVALIGRRPSALIRIVSWFAGITLVSFGMNVVAGLRYTRVSAEILFDMRLDVYRHLQRLSPRFHAVMPLGQVVSRLNADISEIQRVLADATLGWLGNVVFLVGTTGMLIWLDWRLFLVSLAVLPPAVIALVVYRRRLEGAVAVMRDRSAGIGTFLIETLQGVRLIAASNAQVREAQRFREKNDSFIDALMSMRRLTYLSGGLPGLFLAAGTAIVFLYGGSRVVAGAMTTGTLVAFVAYQMRLLTPVQALMGLYANLATARVSLRRVYEILNTPPEVEDAPAGAPPPPVEGRLAFDQVTLSFGRGNAVLRNVSLRADPGECVAIVGPSGGGKSTIADLAVRLLDPDQGVITLDGRDLRTLPLAHVRQCINVVDQRPFLFNDTIAHNIRYARSDATDDQVLEAARAAGLAPLLTRLPDGLDTPVGEAGRTLSVGERQRVAIARALLANPAVLVLDEPTAGLDPAAASDVIEGYQAVMRGRTTLIITHRRELARQADRVIVLDGAETIECGAPDELWERHGAFYRLFNSPQRAR